MLREKEIRKVKEMEAKEKRKRERERKKLEKTEKAKKKKERERVKRVKLLVRDQKRLGKRSRSSSSESETELQYVDDSDNSGPVCKRTSGIRKTWIECESCGTWWYLKCAGQNEVFGLTDEERALYIFVCNKCM